MRVPTPRVPTLRYSDPLEEIWTTCAERIGFRITRTSEAYAISYGDGTIGIGTPEIIDPDDGLAQMILHELCHALIEPEERWHLADWGLDNTSLRDLVNEEASLRVQIALTRPHGLRRVLASTTDHRAMYDALPEDPFEGEGEGPGLARIAMARAGRKPFAPHLAEALAATEAVVRATAPFSPPSSLWSTIDPPPAQHPAGFLLGVHQGSTCESCAWLHHLRGVARCRHAAEKRIDPAWPGCERWEPALDCQACGACCREAYHSVTIGPREAVLRRHPELVEKRENYLELRREDGGKRCAALEKSTEGRYRCTIYEDRPSPCRGLERSGANCLEARRRVGLTLP